MPGFWGSILFYIAGHGKLFIADVDGMSASNEIPLFVSQIPFLVRFVLQCFRGVTDVYREMVHTTL
jgi:hypothetical protein